MNSLEILLEKRWILKYRNRELYYQIKDDIKNYKKFIEEKLGYQLIINPYVIKMEKLPGEPKGFMGLKDFQSKMEYVFLCLILIFLEDKSAEEQFVLSGLTEFILGNYPEEGLIDWTLYDQRRKLIKVLRFVVEEGLIKLNDGNEGKFAEEEKAEVLYENTGVSRYFMRQFPFDIMDFTSYKDFAEGEWLDAQKERGIRRRHRVYRRIIMTPAVYANKTEDQDYLYIKNYRNMIENDLENVFDVYFHVHKSSAYMILKENSQFKDVFPNGKNISDIVLQLNRIILNKIKDKVLVPRNDDKIVISLLQLEQLINECREKYSIGWSKSYRELKIEKLREETIKFMKEFMFLEITNDEEVILNPIIGKITGKYPKTFTEK